MWETNDHLNGRDLVGQYGKDKFANLPTKLPIALYITNGRMEYGHQS